jgi:hypothetical protein
MGFITPRSFPSDEAFGEELALCSDLTRGRPFGVNLTLSSRPEANAAVQRWLDMALARGVRIFEDGLALKAASALGCDLGSMGTRFIATQESLGSVHYKQMLEQSSLDDVMATRAFTGLPANFLKPSIVQVGLDPAALDETVSVQEARERFGGGSESAVIQRWADLWSAGHSVSGVTSVPTVAELIRTLRHEFNGSV